MSIAAPSPVAPPPPAMPSPGEPLARRARWFYWPAVLGLAALNAWWAWDARPIPNLAAVEDWIGVEKAPPSRVPAWWEIGSHRPDNRSALAVLWRALRKSPNDDYARFLLGRALGAANDLQGSAEQLRLVPAWSTRKAEAQLGEILAWQGLNRLRDAEAAMLAYLDINSARPTPRPERVRVETWLLDIYAWEDRWDEARELYWRAFRDAKGDPASRRAILETIMRTHLERIHPSGSLAKLREVLAVEPDNWDARRGWRLAADAEKLYDEADRAMARCLAERPKDPEIWGDWIAVLDGRNDFDRLEEALAAAPPEAYRDGRLWMVRGKLARQAKDHPTAAKAFAKALELNPSFLDAYYPLAQELQFLDRGAEAEPFRRRHQELLAMSKEVPDAVNAYKDVVESPSPAPAFGPPGHASALGRLPRYGAGRREADGWAAAAEEF